jgi:hypothetical protein
MTEAEVLEHLGVPALITEQPRTGGQSPPPAGQERREQRRYTYYYLSTSGMPDILITFEDGMVVKTGSAAP